MGEKTLRVVALQAENFKRLKAVRIETNGDPIVNVTGQNAQGKSSVLDAIWAALAGERAAPAVPIRRGAETAEVTVDLGEMIVTRKWTDKGSTLTVKSRDGMKFGSPQKMLDSLVGPLSFDPLAFNRSKPDQQVDTLKALVGLDFRLLDQQRKTFYDQRTDVNREVTQLRAQLEAMKIVEAPDEPVSVTDLLKEQDEQLAVQRQHDNLRRAAEDAVKTVKGANERLARAKEALARAQQELAEAEVAATKAREAEEEATGELALAAKPDLASIREKLSKAEQTNALVRSKKDRAAIADKLRAREKDAAALTEKIEKVDNDKAAALAKAEFPVAGLSFDDAGVTLNGLPLAQGSAAEQLRTSVAIGASLNKRVRIILVKDGSLFDHKSLGILREIAEELDLQVWLERVDSGSESGVLIEDGEVVAVRPAGRVA